MDILQYQQHRIVKKRYHILVMVMMYICFNISPELIATTYAAKEKIVHLRNSSHTLLLQNYLIDEVVDMREDKTRIGYMRTAVTEKYFNVKYPQLLAKELQTYITIILKEMDRLSSYMCMNIFCLKELPLKVAM